MNRLVAALTFLALVGCSQGDTPAGKTASGSAVRGQGAAAAQGPRAGVRGTAPVFGLASAAAAPGSAYEARIRKQSAFADLPDRGELLSYVGRGGNRSARVEGAYTWHRVDISEEHALRAIASGHLRLPTPSGQTLDIRYDHHVEHPSGDLSWVGHVDGDPGAQTVITFGAEAVYGSIGQPGKRSLRLTTRNGAGWIVETDPGKLVGIASAGANPRKRDALAVPKRRAAAADARPAPPQAAPPAAAAAATGTTIDLLIGYSQGFASAQGGTSAAITRLNQMVTVGNEALANSQVNARVRLVHAMQVNYTDDSTNESALQQLTGYDSDSNDYTTPNAAFNALRAARETYGADLVSLVRDFRDPEQDGCGIAWLIGGGQSGVLQGDEYFGYSVVSDGYDENGADTYFCREETLIHELAHNLGSQHDRESAADGSDGDDDELEPDEYGVFAYSFGFRTDASAGNFYTVMAYGEDGQIDYRVFSSPRIAICGGRACGTANDDNARSLGQTASIIASFRASSGSVLTGVLIGAGNKCIDAAGRGTANGTAIQVYACNYEAQQQWRWNLQEAPGPIVGVASNRVVDAIGYGTTNGTRLQLYDATGNSNQSWSMTDFAIVGIANKVLDAVGVSSANGTEIQLWTNNRTANQIWNFHAADGSIRGIGGKCLDVRGFGTANGTPVQLWTCTGTANQRWRLAEGGVILGYGDKCLEAANGTSHDGTRVRMWDCNGGGHQQWRVKGHVRGQASNRCVDDPASGRQNGSRPHLWDCHKGANQQWEFLWN